MSPFEWTAAGALVAGAAALWTIRADLARHLARSGAIPAPIPHLSGTDPDPTPEPDALPPRIYGSDEDEWAIEQRRKERAGADAL